MSVVKSWWTILGGTLLLVLLLAFWWASRALVKDLPGGGQEGMPEPENFVMVSNGENPEPPPQEDLTARDAGALENERVVMFKDRKSMEDFMARVGEGLRVMGEIPQLNALRVAFTDIASLMKELEGEDEPMLIFPVTIPPLPDGGVQAGAMEIGNQVLQWLGVDAANPAWGAGVKIAVLDSGVVPDSSMGTISQLIELVSGGTDLSLHNGHGTAVASILVGKTEEVPGIVPSAEIISVRVADDAGVSNSFLLAQGIMEAVNAGAQLVNISMGGYGSSPVLQAAVDFAVEQGVLVVAAAGNKGIDLVQNPAAMEGVIGVGAVDALGTHMDFSNAGQEVDVVAPGFGVNANWMDGQTVSVSGTSFSAPIVTGAIAAVMTADPSNPLTAVQAWNVISEYLNDAGAAGADMWYGAGMPDLGRVLAKDTPGIQDAALGSLSLLAPDAGHPYGQVEALIQNRGTEALTNVGLILDSGGVIYRGNLTTLAPGKVQTIRIPVTQPLDAGLAEEFRVRGAVWLPEGQSDMKSSNDGKQFVYRLNE